MDFKEIIKMGLEEYSEDLNKALEGLTPQERRFQPGPDSHHIDFTVWHMARVEDDWVQGFAQSTDRIWNREGWPEKLGLPARGNGFGFTAEDAAAIQGYDTALVMEYYADVRRESLRYLGKLSPEDLERCPRPEQRPGYSIGKMFSHIIVEEAQHVGQVAFLRGLQRGLNK